MSDTVCMLLFCELYYSAYVATRAVIKVQRWRLIWKTQSCIFNYWYMFIDSAYVIPKCTPSTSDLHSLIIPGCTYLLQFMSS